MSCLPCFGSKKSNSRREEEDQPLPVAQAKELPPASPSPPPVSPSPHHPHASTPPSPENRKHTPSPPHGEDDEPVNVSENANAKTFTFRELASATKNFRKECLLGESGFGKVYRGTLQSSGQVVAVKQLDRNGMQGNKEFLVEVLMLTLLHHPNLVKLIGYCADGDQRLLVYEYMPGGSLATHLLDVSGDKKPLDWNTRMKIASGSAQGLEYLHEKANPPVIYRDLKASNILLDEQFNPRLTDYGLAKLGLGNNMLPSQRVMGTYGYSAPEYERTGGLTMKSDIYSFGVVLLELITGRRAMDTTRPADEQNLVSWAQPYFRDPKRFPELADPLLNSRYPLRSLNQVVGVAAMCLQDEPSVRPLVGDVVAALSFLTVVPFDEPIASPPATPPTPIPPEASAHEHGEPNHKSKDTSRSSSSDDDDDKGCTAKDSSDDDHKGSTAKDSSDDDHKGHLAKHSRRSQKNAKYDKQSSSSSESLYHEDDDEDSPQEGQLDFKKSMKQASKSRTRSRKRNIGESEHVSVSHNSSRSSNSSFGSGRKQKRAYSNLSRKSTGKSRCESSKYAGSIKSRGSSDEEESSDGESGSNIRQDSHARSVSSTSNFSLDSGCYSNVEAHDEHEEEE